MRASSQLFTSSEVLFSLHRTTTGSPSLSAQDSQNIRVLFNEAIDLASFRKQWANNGLLTERAVHAVKQSKATVTTNLMQTLEYIVNELAENIHKYSCSDDVANIKVIDLPQSRSANILTIKTHSTTTRAHIQNLLRTFRGIKGTHPEIETSDSGRRSYGWVTITMFNTLVHIIAQKLPDRNAYDLEVVVMVSEKITH